MTEREAIKILSRPFSMQEAPKEILDAHRMAIAALEKQEQTKEAIPHRNHQYLSDYWCECGWHLGKYNDVKFCANCGRKINWEKRKYKLPEPYTEEES